jgi:uncharacterized membrane protein required for colicin V production
VNAVDIVLLLILAGAFILGFFQGVIRGLLAIGAWAVAFLLAANLRDPVGGYLASQWTNLSVDYVHMLAFGLMAILTLAVLLVLIQVGTRGPKGVTSMPLLDDLMAGLLGVVLAVLIMAATSVTLGTFYRPSAPGGALIEAEWSVRLYAFLIDSTVGSTPIGLVTPLMDLLFGWLTPQVVRDAMR